MLRSLLSTIFVEVRMQDTNANWIKESCSSIKWDEERILLLFYSAAWRSVHEEQELDAQLWCVWCKPQGWGTLPRTICAIPLKRGQMKRKTTWDTIQHGPLDKVHARSFRSFSASSASSEGMATTGKAEFLCHAISFPDNPSAKARMPICGQPLTSA